MTFIIYAARDAAAYVITAVDTTVTVTRNSEVIETEVFATADEAAAAAVTNALDWSELVA